MQPFPPPPHCGTPVEVVVAREGRCRAGTLTVAVAMGAVLVGCSGVGEENAGSIQTQDLAAAVYVTGVLLRPSHRTLAERLRSRKVFPKKFGQSFMPSKIS